MPPPALAAPAMVPPEQLTGFISRLQGYLKPEDITRIGEAYVFAEMAHAGQFRISGEPYVSHPLAVAETLAEWRLDPQALIAALLHDVMEDSGVTKGELAERFGSTVADLIDGVSKLDRIESQSYEEIQAQNFRKMMLAMARDLRVVLIKLADRLHNMRTLEVFRPEKRRRIAAETLDIYAPIANRLGLNSLYRELQDLSFKNHYPLRHAVLSKAIKAARGNRREVMGKIRDAVEQRLAEAEIPARVQAREKTVSSLYRKMTEKRLTFSQVLDIYGIRVIVQDINACYVTLGVLHGLFKPVFGKFKDYIAIPKSNSYQSLHSTLIGPYGTPIELQIRTEQMHSLNENGVASHWLYKDVESTGDLQHKAHIWLQSLLELQDASGDSTEFLEHVKVDLFPGEVYAFTPKGRIYSFPRGATVVDFAYAVHTDVGHRCVAARVNQDLVPLRTELKSGDQVEIITATAPNPNPAWLSYVRTGKARSHIRGHLKNRQHDESLALGERLLVQALAELNKHPRDIEASAWERVMRDSGNQTQQQVLTDIGVGKRLAAVVARRLLAAGSSVEEAGDIPSAPSSAVHIRGTEGMAVTLARCCRPIPGDPIIGSIRKGQGLVVHTHDCHSIRKSRSSEPGKWIEVEWDAEPGRLFDVRIRVETRNCRGVLARVAAAISDAEANIDNVFLDEDHNTAYSTIHFTVQVAHRKHLASVMRNLRLIQEVVRIVREKEA